MSPDLNPIENVWNILKANVHTHDPKDLQQLRKAIAVEWKALPKDLAKNLVNSMKKRIQDTIDAKGDYINY